MKNKAFLYLKPIINQSGKKNIWIIDFSSGLNEEFIDSSMEIIGSKSTEPQIRLDFKNKKDALKFLTENNIEYEEISNNNTQEVLDQNIYKSNIKPKIYRP